MKHFKLPIICLVILLISAISVIGSNDVCSDANTLNIDSSYNGQINPQGDIDWGKWYVSAPGTLTIDLDVPSNKDYDLAVYSSCSTRECLRARGTGADEQCVIEVQPGWYYSKVWGAYGQYSSTATYYIAGSFEEAYSPEYDLRVSSAYASPSNPTANEPFTIHYTVKNDGPDDYSGSFRTTLYIDGSSQGSISRPSISAGGTQSFDKRDIRLSAGQHTARIVTDSSNDIDETNEGNNEQTFYVTVSPVNPCAGVTCNDYCSGTTLNYNGHCSGGNCYYSQEPMSVQCGYDACAFMLCEDSCSGTTLTTSAGCSDGDCHYYDISNSPDCGYVGPVTCDDYCNGTTRYYDGDGSSGTCNYQIEINSTSCGYVDPTDHCDGIVCDQTCDGTTALSNGYCEAGSCVYDLEPLSTSCGYTNPTYSGTIVLDAGHYPDYNDGREYILNDKVVSALQPILEADGFTVNRTNQTMSFSERGNLADDVGAEILLSVHFNSFGGTTNGTESFYYDADDKVFCDVLQPLMVDIVPSRDRGVKPDTATNPGELTILRSRDGSACLVEPEAYDSLVDVTFNGVNYSNFYDMLSSDDYIAALTEALRMGIHEYYDDNVCPPGGCTNPCEGIVCDQTCDGTTALSNGICSDGICTYDMDPMSPDCGYDACAFMLCEDYCNSTTLYTSSGCSDGDCNYVAIENAPECSTVDPCDGVDTADNCVGQTLYFDGVCSDGIVTYSQMTCAYDCVIDVCIPEPLDCPDRCLGSTHFTGGYNFGGTCVYLTIEENSIDCGYEPPESDLQISSIIIYPTTIDCDNPEMVYMTVQLFNSGAIDATDVGIEYISDTLGGLSSLSFDVHAGGSYNERFELGMSDALHKGKNSITVSVVHDGETLTDNIDMVIPQCSDYYIEHIDEIPDMYQRDTDIRLEGKGWSQCGPSSITNVLVWLYLNGFTNLSSGTETEAINRTVHELSGINYTNADRPQGVDPKELLRNISAYVSDKGYNVTNMQFQGWKPVDDKYDTNVTMPDMNWIKEGISDYSGTLIHYGWYTHNAVTDTYKRTGGHWVTAAGYGLNESGDRDSDILIFHDPVTGPGFNNEYVEMINITSGSFVHTHTTIPTSAEGFHILDGAYLLTINHIVPDYVIIEGAVRFNIEEIEREQTPIQSSVINNAGNGGGGGSGGYTITQTVPQPVEEPGQYVNPAHIALKSPEQIAAETSAEDMVTGQTVPGSNMNIGTGTNEPVLDYVEPVDVSPTGAVVVEFSSKVKLNCESDSDCGSGNECIPSNFFAKIFATPQCCPAGSNLVDGKCITPRTSLNDACSKDIPCATNLDCKETGPWFNIFDNGEGICCSPTNDIKNNKCVSEKRLIHSRTVN